MLSTSGLRFHRALAPYLQRVVGSAHPAVGWVLGYTSFFIVVFLSSCVAFYFYYFVRLRVPLLTFGPPGRFYSRGDAGRGDVTRFPFSGSDSSPCQDLSAT